MIYVLHFEEKIGNASNPRGQAQHYIGWAADEAALQARIEAHRAGHGAAITAHLARQGIGFVVAMVVAGDRTDERRLKNRKDTPRWCPVCRQVSRNGGDHG